MEASRSRGSAEIESRVLTGVEGMRGLVEVDKDNWSLEGVLRNRGLTMVGFWICWRLSREAAGRNVRGIGSLEGRGMPDGLVELGECSMVVEG